MRECGLKPSLRSVQDLRYNVTPHAGVWIETICFFASSVSAPSLPMRECGLKHNNALGVGMDMGSLPMRECGLKQSIERKIALRCVVTPHAGVWIETP